MANYANLLATIAANIYSNGNQEVTAAMAKTAMDAMVASLGAGYQFMGVATPSTNPGAPDQNVWYLASTPGTYANFGGLVVSGGEVCALCWNGVWAKKGTNIPTSFAVGYLDGFINIDTQQRKIIVSGTNRNLTLESFGQTYVITGGSNFDYTLGVTFYYAICFDVESLSIIIVPWSTTNKYPVIGILYCDSTPAPLYAYSPSFEIRVDGISQQKKWNELLNAYSLPPQTSIKIEQGATNSDGSPIGGSLTNFRVRNVGFIQVNGKFTFDVPGYNYNVFYYTSEDYATFVNSEGVWIQGEISREFIGYIRFCVKKYDGSQISPSDVNAVLSLENTNSLLYNFFSNYYSSVEYVVGTDFIKRKVKTSRLGSLKYLQAFCKYNGKYYSIDGNNIAVQDSNFDVEQDVPLNTGHGNSLQLVSGGKAWASGWNDNKAYRVDLSTLQIDLTITIPTTGYTTVAVDDVNELMYIFQRTSYPDTVDTYNFIVYDYANNSIKSTKKIERFGAMQSVDFYQGKIIMSYGLGTQSVPSGMRIYDTNGNVMAFFELAISNREYEGVMIERESFELLISTVDKDLFKIESAV